MSMIRVIVSAALGISLVTTNGCASLLLFFGAEPQPPEISLVQVNVRRWSLDEIDLQIGLEVLNREDVQLSIEKIDYVITLNAGDELGRGGIDRRMTLASRGRLAVEVPLTVKAATLMRLIQQIVAEGKKPQLNLAIRADLQSSFGLLRVERNISRSIDQLVKSRQYSH